MSLVFFLLRTLSESLTIMTPLLFAATGGLFTELGGMLNIALEGLMLSGAFFGIAAAGAAQSPLVGAFAGMAASMGLAAIYAFCSLKLRANEFISGMAANLLAIGLCSLLSQKMFGTRGVVSLSVPGLSHPWLAALFVCAALVWTLASWFLIRKTGFGLRLRAAGLAPETLAALGVKVERYRFAAILISGAASGLAGISLSFGLSAYVPNISSGRGWIALAAIFLGGKKPSGILAACFIFAFAESLSNRAQGFLRIPGELILALPYIASLAALVIASLKKRTASPRHFEK